MTLRTSQSRSGRRIDSSFQTGAAGLTNSRTRIVGDRTGPAADAVITGVRLVRAMRTIIARSLGRIASVVTPVGWVALAFVPLGLGVGYRFAWTEFVVLGYAAAVLVVVAAVYLVGRSAFSVSLRIAHDRVVVGETALGLVVVHNPGSRRTLAGAVEVPVGGGLAEVAVPGVPRASDISREFAIPTSQRGVIAVGPARTIRADPIGLVRRELVWSGTTDLYVHPRTISVPSLSSGLVRDLEGNPTRDLTASDISFHALREYTSGDERRSIHWKSTARTGRYMVRQFEESRRSQLVIALSLASRDYATDEEFELAVSVAGSLGARAIRDTRDVSVVVSGKTPEFAVRKVFSIDRLTTVTTSRLLDDLAVLDRADAALTIVDLSRVAGAELSGVSLAFLVCGSATSPGDIRAASLHYPAGVEVVVIVCDPGAVPELRRVQGLSVFVVGRLDDLRVSLQRAANG